MPTNPPFGLLVALAVFPITARAQDVTSSPATAHHILTITTLDNLTIEAKLTLPPKAEGSAPPAVVFHLHGAGPRTYDSPFPYRAEDGSVQWGKYLDFHAAEFAERGIAFCGVSKRGCTATDEPPYMKVDREVFAGATFPAMLGDYGAVLKALRERDDIDGNRIILLGASEGTRIGPLLAERAPEGVIGVFMMGYAADNAHDTVVWQNTVGPWRNIQHLIPAARDGSLTKEEHEAFAQASPDIARAMPFAALDADANGVIDDEEMRAAVKPRLDAILKAVEERDDELIRRAVMGLSSAYLLSWWEAEPNKDILLRLDIPLFIYHGGLDGACRVEGVRETEAAFKEAGKTNLTVRIYPESNHDLDWTRENAASGGPQPYRDAFDDIKALATSSKATR